MKTLITKIILPIVLLLSNQVNSQSIWLTIEDLETTTSTEEFDSMNEEFNLTIKKPLSNSRNPKLQKVYEFSCDCDVVDLYVAAHKIPNVKGIEYGPVYETLNEPNDYNTYQNMSTQLNSGWHLDMIWAQAAWDVTHGTTPVAVSDQNLFPNHEDIQGKLIHYDTTNTSSQGHGTAVSTLAAGNTNNNVGLSSIGYDSPLAFYRMNYNEVIAASQAGYRVINLSWSSGCDYSQYVQDAINEVYNNGTFIIAAAGNGSTCGGPTELVYPATYENVFAVSSVGYDDSHENVFNSNSTHQHNSSVDLVAPGYQVAITAAPNWILFGSGTSYASPIVTGTVGLIVSTFPTITNEEIEYILQSTATNIDDINPNYLGMLGSGRLNAGEAVKTALSLYLLSQTPNPVNPIGEEMIEEELVTQNTLSLEENKLTQNNSMIQDGVYDLNGKLVDLNKVGNGIYLIVENGLVIKKIWK